MASGRPVIAYGRGGATETVVAGTTGIFFEEQTVEGLMAAVERFERIAGGFDPRAIRAHAARFNTERFVATLRREIGACLDRDRDRAAAELLFGT
jgi:glycosyltransferase involved in cell wall biosynthesis